LDQLVIKGVPLTPVEFACALLVPLLWGFQYVVIKVGLTAFPPLFFVGLRFLVIAALLLPFVERPTKREIGPIIGISIFAGGLNFGLSFVGLEYGQAGVSSVVNQLSTPFMVLLAWPMLGERPSLRVILGVALAFGGVALLMLGPSAAVRLVPVIFMMGAGFALAVGSVLTKRYGPFEPLKLLAWMAALTVPQVFLASLLVEHGQLSSLSAATTVNWLAFAYTVVFGGIAGFGLWFWLIKTHSMTRVAPFALLQTLFAVGAGLIVLREPVTWSLVLGMLVCAGGVAITQAGSAKPRRVPRGDRRARRADHPQRPHHPRGAAGRAG
jgi:O-acetylserine/cysteine efflux transporter